MKLSHLATCSILLAVADHSLAAVSAEEPSEQVALKIDVKEGDWDAPISNIRGVCLSAAQEIWAHVPNRKMAPISIRQSKKGPMVVYGLGPDGERRVLLNVNGRYWAQFAFQFSHEFCHILCNYRDVKNPNLWFEESLCETASLFALRRMAETWKTKPPYQNWKSYSTALKTYADDRLKSTKSLEGTSLAKWYRKHELSLRKTATDREKNQVVAVAVLKLLETDPQHWQAISYLNQWDKNRELSFEAYLLDWYRRVPKPQKNFVADVAALFEISLKL